MTLIEVMEGHEQLKLNHRSNIEKLNSLDVTEDVYIGLRIKIQDLYYKNMDKFKEEVNK